MIDDPDHHSDNQKSQYRYCYVHMTQVSQVKLGNPNDFVHIRT